MPVGRPPKPTLIRKLEGNRGRRPIRETVHMPSRPVAPANLGDEQKKLWCQIEQAMPAGVLTAADTQVLERMVVAWTAFRECCHHIAQHGMFAEGSKGQEAVSAAVKIRAMAAKEMHAAGEVLGLSPVARARIVSPETIDDDPLALLLDGGVYRVPAARTPKTN